MSLADDGFRSMEKSSLAVCVVLAGAGNRWPQREYLLPRAVNPASLRRHLDNMEGHLNVGAQGLRGTRLTPVIDRAMDSAKDSLKPEWG